MEEFDNRKLIHQTTSKKLQSLFSKKQFITLPTTADTFTNLLQIQPSELECENCKSGKYASWDIEEVFNLIYARMNDGEEYYALQYYGDKKFRVYLMDWYLMKAQLQNVKLSLPGIMHNFIRPR